MDKLTIRLFEPGDEEPLSNLIRRTIREVNSKDYTEAESVGILEQYTPDYVTSISEAGSLYVALMDGVYVGCGGITPHEDNPGEGYILAVFTNPDYLGHGIGSIIMAAIEADPIFKKASRVELHASLTAHGFYNKLGYAYSAGAATAQTGHYDNGCYQMEKRNAVP